MNVRRFAPLFLLGLLLAVPASAQADGRVASAIGVKEVNGEKFYVDVVVAVRSGQSAKKVTGKALSQQGASRVKPGGGGTEYPYTGLKWDDLPVIQNYNASNERVAAKDNLIATHTEWSGVTGSTFDIRYGDDLEATDCPSLVNECRGPRYRDSLNDVAWLRLGGSTLAVTWYTISGGDEADMALNTRFRWKDTCDSNGSGYDVETVLLHENGHVAGLGHVTTTTESVMYPSYLGPDCSLYPYDEAGLAELYPR